MTSPTLKQRTEESQSIAASAKTILPTSPHCASNYEWKLLVSFRRERFSSYYIDFLLFFIRNS